MKTANAHIALVNHYEPLKNEHSAFRSIVAAICAFANGAWGAAWGDAPMTGAYYEDPSRIPFDATIFTIVGEQKDVPGALAFHDEQGFKPYGTVLAKTILDDAGGGLLCNKNGCSLAGAAAHEVFEWRRDKSCNLWVRMPNGWFIAGEVCDSVQDLEVVVKCAGADHVVGVSDAVLPAYFDAQAPEGTQCSIGGFDKPFERTEGGYRIMIDPSKANEVDGGEVQAEWGPNMNPAIRQMKADGLHGRTHKRMAAHV